MLWEKRLTESIAYCQAKTFDHRPQCPQQNGANHQCYHYIRQRPGQPAWKQQVGWIDAAPNQDEVAIETAENVIDEHSAYEEKEKAAHCKDILADWINAEAFGQGAVQKHGQAQLEQVNGSKGEGYQQG